MTSAVSVGAFDGLHLGHRQILSRTIARARERAGRSVVVSFDPHPDLVLAKSFQAVAPLSPLPEKRERLAVLGVDELRVLPFTRELASLEPEEFVERHLVRPHALHALVVGVNFALGRGRSGNVPRLREIGRRLGFEVETVPLLEIGGDPVTSTRIRGALVRGRVDEAARLLGRWYALGGAVVTGDAIGRTLGVPTANLRLHDEKFLPADGIYAVWARIGSESVRRPGAMSIGVRPTFGGQERTLEVHLIDWSGDLLGADLEVELVDWIRPELRFESAEALSVAMREDLAEARRRLAAAPAEVPQAG
ncbi:MAG: bifunctional riboflavin kinase/FAD synthetase [Candidatus Eisenbacteria bacterium]|uniref:Riboflavin biosynthesis protein n=1 Tax=Eiseniibacteriota bacterium TaxID=2212470 RepID=A0A538SGT0_UNCEI|nr:MAG: bifunctional riboflavin kinase/FAD synthetase [Candidatus Eisenbacteria bacterium]